MKPSTTILFFFFFILAFSSCRKPDNKSSDSNTVQAGISYPDSIYYGKNILSFTDSTILQDGTNYEIGAVLENDASLRVVITNYPVTDTTSGHQTDWYYNSENGWLVGDYDDFNHTQEFSSILTGNIYVGIIFFSYGQTGHCKIEFYENGQTLTRTKHFFWQ